MAAAYIHIHTQYTFAYVLQVHVSRSRTEKNCLRGVALARIRSRLITRAFSTRARELAGLALCTRAYNIRSAIVQFNLALRTRAFAVCVGFDARFARCPPTCASSAAIGMTCIATRQAAAGGRQRHAQPPHRSIYHSIISIVFALLAQRCRGCSTLTNMAHTRGNLSYLVRRFILGTHIL